ncbi:MAG: hypothetical protein HXX10_23270 [Rhodoplanes sp.]|uniref:hypothetical protein n=1 Tax=Rhodoplanes sp. TaxID=1968906 RepID=UPI0018395376|nr:hypothetical protein [Rhodoplanes sp.]NVO16957.1 hypothetical protein [Rhodoplanes sp.]
MVGSIFTGIVMTSRINRMERLSTEIAVGVLHAQAVATPRGAAPVEWADGASHFFAGALNASARFGLSLMLRTPCSVKQASRHGSP